MIDAPLVHYMEVIDHLSVAKAYIDKTDAWIGAEIHVIIEKVKGRAGSQAYESVRNEWNNTERVGG